MLTDVLASNKTVLTLILRAAGCSPLPH